MFTLSSIFLFFQVFLFLRSVIKFVFSLNVVWGTDKNEKAFLKNLEKFLLCRRFDVITVKDLLLGISVPNISWLAGIFHITFYVINVVIVHGLNLH